MADASSSPGALPGEVTVRMTAEQKNELVAKAESEGASLNQFVLKACGLKDEINFMHASRGRRAKQSTGE